MARKHKAVGFYGGFLSAAVGEAMESGSLEDLRRRVMFALMQQPGEQKLLLRGTNTLTRVAATERKLSLGEKNRLRDSMSELLESLGSQLLPAEYGGS
ncbi:MAG: hypothetical protein ABI559_05990 [Chloroflexota bacterium]